MTIKDKLVERFKRLPKDFTFEETVKLLSTFGYVIHNKNILTYTNHIQVA